MEARNDLARRLQKRSDWPEIEANKNAAIKRYRSEGLPRNEASDKAWNDLATQYPPATITDENTVSQLDQFAEAKDFAASAMWVFDNLVCKVAESDAPGAGAWAMLQWARENQADFFRHIAPKAIEIAAKQGGGSDEDAIEENAEIVDMVELLRG